MTIQAGQRVVVNSSAALGVGAAAGNNLFLDVCYQLQPGGIVTVFPGSAYLGGLTLPANQRQVFTTQGIVSGLAAGTYTVGMCGVTGDNNTNWSNNDWSQVIAYVLTSSVGASPAPSPVVRER